jgi:hypothetical protein
MGSAGSGELEATVMGVETKVSTRVSWGMGTSVASGAMRRGVWRVPLPAVDGEGDGACTERASGKLKCLWDIHGARGAFGWTRLVQGNRLSQADGKLITLPSKSHLDSPLVSGLARPMAKGWAPRAQVTGMPGALQG